VEFELQQVICDTFDSHILINPLSVVCICLVLVICTSVPARRPGCITVRFVVVLAHLRFSSGLFA
jgi:hypothetical protein